MDDEQSAAEMADKFYEKLEKFSKKISESFKNDVLPEMKKTARENPVPAILGAFVAGVLVALFVSSGGRRGGQ